MSRAFHSASILGLATLLGAQVALAEADQAEGGCCCISNNQLPTFGRSWSTGEKHFRAYVGRTLKVSLDATDPDGQPLRFQAQSLPPGATLDSNTGEFVFTPSPGQQGKHEIEVEVSDGRAAITAQLELDVQPNHPPEQGTGRVLYLAVGRSLWPNSTVGIVADVDGDTLSVKPISLPGGARLLSTDRTISLDWEPTEADVGEHVLDYEVSDGLVTRRMQTRVVVLPAYERDSWLRAFMPGFGPAAYLLQKDGETFLGGAFDVTFFALRPEGSDSHRCMGDSTRSYCHPSHQRYYAEFEVMDSMRAHKPAIFTYGLGFSRTLEWYPGRRTLIPFYGVELGGLARKELGHRIQTRPYLGAHLWASDAIWLDLAAGYRVVPLDLAELSGPTLAMTLILNPW